MLGNNILVSEPYRLSDCLLSLDVLGHSDLHRVCTQFPSPWGCLTSLLSLLRMSGSLWNVLQ